MIELRKVHGDNIPEVIEYLGMNEWAVRWDISGYSQDNITGYEYCELKFNEEPTYDLFVTRLIRLKYTQDQEDALKSNIVNQMVTGIITLEITDEWREFQDYRTEAKTIGKGIFNN